MDSLDQELICSLDASSSAGSSNMARGIEDSMSNAPEQRRGRKSTDYIVEMSRMFSSLRLGLVTALESIQITYGCLLAAKAISKVSVTAKSSKKNAKSTKGSRVAKKARNSKLVSHPPLDDPFAGAPSPSLSDSLPRWSPSEKSKRRRGRQVNALMITLKDSTPTAYDKQKNTELEETDSVSDIENIDPQGEVVGLGLMRSEIGCRTSNQLKRSSHDGDCGSKPESEEGESYHWNDFCPSSPLQELFNCYGPHGTGVPRIYNTGVAPLGDIVQIYRGANSNGTLPDTTFPTRRHHTILSSGNENANTTSCDPYFNNDDYLLGGHTVTDDKDWDNLFDIWEDLGSSSKCN
ncbi:hypothetical protein RUND412_002416 [Rhizina undulata]